MGTLIGITMAHERLLDYFRAHGATSASRATARPELDALERDEWKALVATDVVRVAPSGRYYMDERKLARLSNRRRRIVTILVWLLPLAIVAAAIFGGIRGQ